MALHLGHYALLKYLPPFIYKIPNIYKALSNPLSCETSHDHLLPTIQDINRQEMGSGKPWLWTEPPPVGREDACLRVQHCYI